MTAWRAAAAAALVVAASAWFVGGLMGVLYAVAFVAATAPGWPVGRALFGQGHAATWIAGALIGYGLTSLALWVPIALGIASWLSFTGAWTATVLLAFLLFRRMSPAVELPPWTTRATLALVVTLALVPALVAVPYRHIGQRDEHGSRRYRAYFTADFVWHEALTAEVARFASPPRNPYMASQPLHYYWGYFLLPSAITGSTAARGSSPPIEPFLKVNALCAGILFVGAIFIAAWAAIPRPGSVAAAVALTLLAASGEGLYQLFDLFRRGQPLSLVRSLNIDAITAWFFYGLTIDGLPRSLWYGPQHAMAAALGLVALTIAARHGREMTPRAAAGAGLALGLALLMSPFPAGTMTLTYGVAVLWDGVRHPRSLARVVAVQSIAVAMVGLGLVWCLVNGTFEGAGGAVEVGLSRAATRDPFTILGLALGPILVAVALGIGVAALRAFPREVRPAVVGVMAAAGLFFFVTLVLEPVWVGWRAGQHFLVVAPGLAALGIAALADRWGRRASVLLVVVLMAAGLPTTVIDFYNCQDTSNVAMGPGFRWTVVLSPGEQDALTWIERHTARGAVVQMSLGPRGRETWSLIPSFARRRMAAGLPISLLRTPEYEQRAAQADQIFASTDGEEAARIARELGAEYLYVGRVEREAFGARADKFASHGSLFGRVFANDDASVYVVY